MKTKTVQISEAQVQKQCLQYIKWHPKVAWAERMNTGGMKRSYKKKGGEQKERYVSFAFIGCSDIIGQLKDGRFLAVEIKRPEFAFGEKKDPLAKLSIPQHNFLTAVNKNGGVAFVADCVEDAEYFLR